VADYLQEYADYESEERDEVEYKAVVTISCEEAEDEADPGS
jgi:hypothetical protein